MLKRFSFIVNFVDKVFLTPVAILIEPVALIIV
jgi:hypothetical protein